MQTMEVDTLIYQYGDVILVHGDNIYSGTIQNLTGSFFAHAAMCVEQGKVIEMLYDGFHYHENGYIGGSRAFMVIRNKYLYFSPPVVVQNTTARMKKYVDLLRQNPPKYDYFEIIRQAVLLLKKKGQHLLRNSEDYYSLRELMETGRRLICSALIDSVYENAGLDLFPDREPYSTTPADIAALASLTNPTFVVVSLNMPLNK
jgi:hypothetical protein